MNTVECHGCGARVERVHAYEQITGYRKPRLAGGANQITLAEPTGLYLCEGCATKLKNGIALGQATLI